MLINVGNHDGSARRDGDVFFVQPDAQLGTLLSATTTLNPGDPRGGRIAMTVVLAVCGAVIGAMIGVPVGLWLLHATLQHAGKAMPVVLAFAAGFGALFAYLFQPLEYNSFLGSEGFARHHRWKFGTIGGRVIRYDDVRDIRVRALKVTMALAHISTSYEYRVKLRRGSWMMRAAVAAKSAPVTASPMHFGNAFVSAWQARQGAAEPAAHSVPASAESAPASALR